MKQGLTLLIGWWTAASPRPRGHLLIPRPPETMLGGCIEPGRFAKWREGRQRRVSPVHTCSEIKDLGPYSQERLHIDLHICIWQI